MALKKETVLVWFSLQKSETFRILSLMAYPASRKRDLLLRVQNAAAKKVRGQRLDGLNWKDASESAIPYLQEYATALSRIASLDVIVMQTGANGAASEAQAMTVAADALKQQFPDCQFEVIFDPAMSRSSIVSGWMKKNQLQGTISPVDEESSLLLRSASLMGALTGLLPEKDPVFADLADQVEKIFSLHPDWLLLGPPELFLQIMEQPDSRTQKNKSPNKNQNNKGKNGSSNAPGARKQNAKGAQKAGQTGKNSKRKGRAASGFSTGSASAGEQAGQIANTQSADDAAIQPLDSEQRLSILRTIWKQQPEWFSQGVLEKWLRKGLSDRSLQILSDAIEQNADFGSLSSLNPDRLISEEKQLLASLQPEPSLFESESGKAFLKDLDNAIEALAEKTIEAAPVSLRSVLRSRNKEQPHSFNPGQPDKGEHPDSQKLASTKKKGKKEPGEEQAFGFAKAKAGLSQNWTQQIESWIHQPQIDDLPPCSILLQARPDGILAMAYQSFGTVPETASNIKRTIRAILLDHADLKPLVLTLSSRKPFVKLFADPKTLRGMRRILFSANAWMPIYPIEEGQISTDQSGQEYQKASSTRLNDKNDRSQTKALDSFMEFVLPQQTEQRKDLSESRSEPDPIQPDTPQAVQPVNLYKSDRLVEPAHLLMNEELWTSLSRSDKRFLLDLPLELGDLRLAAMLLKKGIRPALIEECSKTPGRLEDLELGVLFPARDKHFFSSLTDPKEKRFYLHSHLKSSSMKAVHHLLEEGVDQEWLFYSVHNNMTPSQIEKLGELYPGKRLPSSWIPSIDLDEDLLEEILDQAAKSRPDLMKEALEDGLKSFLHKLIESEALARLKR